MAGWLSAGVALLLVAATLVAYVRYRSVWSSIHRINITGLGQRPPQYNSALNVLLIGSDSRAGSDHSFGAGVQGQRSDTIMILHLSPGHRRATVLSIPRDSVVPQVACPSGAGFAGQQASPGNPERINATFANGGPGCLWKTIEQETGIHLDHFIELDFTGFEHIIDDLGGVNICLPVAINDPASGLRLTAGRHHVMGAEALAFWRERHIGTGSDLQRIQRDQYLMASLLQGVAHSDILGNPARMYSIVVDTASAMTTDSGLDLGTLVKIADSLRGVSSGSVQFVQVPEVPYPSDPQAEVMFQQPQSGTLFSAIAHDTVLPRRGARTAKHPRPRGRGPSGSRSASPSVAASATGAPSATPSPSPSASPSISGLSRTYGGIKGSAPACHDQAAFAGGDVPSDFSTP